MREILGNLWTVPADWRVITTNGSIRKDGKAVMGRGCAREAVERFPRLPSQLGHMLARHGNKVFVFSECQLITFPVKHEWKQQADVELIRTSVAEFAELIAPQVQYVMPRPGCGNGWLEWSDVRPLLEGLPDNVRVVHFG